MDEKIRLAAVLSLVAAGLVPGTACRDELVTIPLSPCCNDFQVGADLTGVDFGVDLSVDGQFHVFAQAAADVGAIASVALSDVEVACRNLSSDFGATEEELAVAKANAAQGTRVKAYCDLVVASIEKSFRATGKFSAVGDLKVVVTPPSCQASVDAAADCSAKCSANGSCDTKATPPMCEGGQDDHLVQGQLQGRGR